MRDLVFLDLETTGSGEPDPDRDRIVEFSFLEGGLGDPKPWTKLVDPGEPIPEERTEVHGISDEDVADAWPFDHYAEAVQRTVEDAVLVGFNSRSYDVPILDRELRDAGRPGLERSDSGFIVHPEIDLRVAWLEHEPRSLEGAVGRFAGSSLGEDAHSAEADAAVLPEVLFGMIRDLGLTDPDGETGDGIEDLVEECSRPGAMDRAGCFRRREDGVVVFDFSKNRGKPVRDELGMLRWMLDRDFPEETRRLCRHFLTIYDA